jgi:REP element-mobilizing transposase RayT
MARPLRVERVGGRYHATARGNERRNIFRDDADRFHFLRCLIAAMLAIAHRWSGCAPSL